MDNKRKSSREYRISILLNAKEQQILDRFCEKYKITNRSRLIRETLIRTILRRMEEDEPTLFD